MEKNVGIAKSEVITKFIGSDGNLHKKTDGYRFCLKDNNGLTISNQYHYMVYLGFDHFAVCNVKKEIDYLRDYDYDDIIKGNHVKINSKFKWGVIRINRDDDENIIPYDEVLVVPYLYDKIIKNNLKSSIVYNKDKLTYLDLDIDSENYCKQLLPCVLDSASPFNLEFDDFAECSIDGASGYLPRNCKPTKSIECSELLTRSQVIYLNEYLKENKNIKLDNNTFFAYFNLTGINLMNEKNKILKKIIKR